MSRVLNRSRSMNSMRTSGGAPDVTQPHGPGLLMGEPGLVSSLPQSKEDTRAFHNESMPSSSGAAVAAAAATADAAAAEARNTYRHRPLPTPPRSKASSAKASSEASSTGSSSTESSSTESPSTMAERPSTSGGLSAPNTSTASFKSYDKRMSKDDMYIRPHSSARGGYKSYHIPLRGNPASPVESAIDFPSARTFTVRTQTPDSMDSNMGTIAIGMAIGSPSHPPPEFTSSASPSRNEWQPQPSYMSTSMTRSSPEPAQEPVLKPAPESASEPIPLEVVETEPPKQKSGRWKLFGRSKSKRLASSPVAISQPMNLQQQIGNKTEMESAPTTRSKASDLGRRNTDKRSEESKPVMVRSQTAGPTAVSSSPSDSKAPKLLSRMASTRSARGERVKKSDISAPVHVHMQVPEMPKPRGNLLDVEIPSIKMERYSVMFGNVLGQPQGWEVASAEQQQTQGSSALLARRQATLDRLKTINGNMIKEDERERSRSRRATSPHANKTSAVSLSLFPATPSTTTNSSQTGPSPRYRSNTSPAFVSSASKSSFESPRPQYYLEAAREKPVTSGPRPRQPPKSSHGFVFDPDKSALLDSPTDDEEFEKIHLAENLKPTIYEPVWQIVSTPDSSSNAALNAAKARSPASASSGQAHNTKKSVDETDPEDVLRAVEISIARQISVSRQQRQMLRPLKNPAVARSSGLKSPAVPVSVGQNERLSSTKTSTPTVISTGETSEQQLAQNRKSERIIVEDE